MSAYNSSDNFDSYSDGGIDGDNGGTNWSIAWGGAGTIKSNQGDFTVQGSVTFNGSTKALKIDGSHASAYIERGFSVTTTGPAFLAMRSDSTTKEVHFFLLTALAGTIAGGIRFNTSGNIQYINSAGSYVNLLTGYSANTWYIFRFDWDTVNHVNQYRVQVGVNGSGYTNDSGYVITDGTVSPAILGIQLENITASGNAYYDSISSTDIMNTFSTLTAVVGTFTKTGYAATIGRLKTLVAAVGSYLFTGRDITVSQDGWKAQSKSSTSWTNLTKHH